MIQNKNIGYALIGFSIILILLLSFIKSNNDAESVFFCELSRENNISMTECPAHKSNTSWLITLSFGISFFILSSGVYLVFIPLNIKEKSEEIDISNLDEEEKEIYRYIKTQEGSVYQSDLVKNTDFSKVKITRILDRLENKKILERKRRGMANLIVLK